jgi:hypothetical protein
MDYKGNGLSDLDWESLKIPFYLTQLCFKKHLSSLSPNFRDIRDIRDKLGQNHSVIKNEFLKDAPFIQEQSTVGIA